MMTNSAEKPHANCFAENATQCVGGEVGATNLETNSMRLIRYMSWISGLLKSSVTISHLKPV